MIHRRCAGVDLSYLHSISGIDKTQDKNMSRWKVFSYDTGKQFEINENGSARETVFNNFGTFHYPIQVDNDMCVSITKGGEIYKYSVYSLLREYFREHGNRWQLDNIRIDKRIRTKTFSGKKYSKPDPKYHNCSSTRRYWELPLDFYESDWEYALDYFEGCCAICGRSFDGASLSTIISHDHWIPLNFEGDNNPGTVPWNIVPLCYGADGCNNKKFNKLPKRWLTETYGILKASEIMERIEKYFDTVSKKVQDSNGNY